MVGGDTVSDCEKWTLSEVVVVEDVQCQEAETVTEGPSQSKGNNRTEGNQQQLLWC